MSGYVIVSIVSGLLFGLMDGLINSNPLARRLNAIYSPIARTKLNLPAGIIIDIFYGFALAGVFLILYDSLPGNGAIKGISFAAVAWFLRVAMSVASNWMVLKIPARTHVYGLMAGLVEMLVLGLVYGLFLKPW